MVGEEEARFDWADWSKRPPELVWLCELDHGSETPLVAMVFAPPGEPFDSETVDVWLDLPPHPNLLDAVGRDEKRQLLLRYAAIDWEHRPLQPLSAPRGLRTLATWGVEICDALTAVFSTIPRHRRWWLTNPFAWTDIDNHVRLGFSHPPLSEDRSPTDECSFVFCAGRLLSALWDRERADEKLPIAGIVHRCLDDRSRRYETLDKLRAALVNAGARTRPRSDQESWDHIETGMGILALDKPYPALMHFEQARLIEPHYGFAEVGRRRALAKLGPVVVALHSQLRAAQIPKRPKRTLVWGEPPRPRTWDDVVAEGQQLETARDFPAALNLYRHTLVRGTRTAASLTALARIHLRLGEAGHAIDMSTQALVLDPKHLEAFSIGASAYLMKDQPAEALKLTDRWLSRAPDDAAAHYARGKCLLPMKQFVDARDAFDRALALDSRMVAAMLLRREADRMCRAVRDAVGTQPPLELDVPPHLPELKPVFAAGKIDDAIALLAARRHADDPAALLLLAACLDFAGRYTEAADTYQRIADRGPEHRHAALLGRAGMLVELGDPDGALDLLDALRADRPDDLDIIEGRAWVLDRLGRADESQAEFRRYVALNQGSARRAGWIRRQR